MCFGHLFLTEGAGAGFLTVCNRQTVGGAEVRGLRFLFFSHHPNVPLMLKLHQNVLPFLFATRQANESYVLAFVGLFNARWITASPQSLSVGWTKF